MNNINNNKIFTCLKNSYSIIWNYDKKYILLNCFISIIQGIIPSILIIVMQKIINNLQKGLTFNIILEYVLLYIFISLLELFISNIFSLYKNIFGLKFSKYISIKMIEQTTELELMDFENKEVYDVISRANSQNGLSIISFISENINLFKGIITLISVSIIIIKFKWWLILLVLLPSFIECIVTIKINNLWYDIRVKRTIDERKSWYINFLFTTGNAFKEIKLFGLKQYFVNKFDKIQSGIISQDISMTKIEFIFSSILDIINSILLGLIYIYIVYQGYISRILIGDVTAYIDSIINIKSNIENIFSSIESIIEQSMYINFLFDFFDLKPNNRKGDLKISSINKIEFKNVSFSYNNGKNVINNINFTIKQGERVAFVGENGSGKTTIIKLILGLYGNYSGQIFINDIDLKKIDIKNYYNKVGCIFQDYVKYEASICENIAFGDIESINNREKIFKTLKTINFNKSICNSQNDLDTIIGNWFGDRQLSLGEWQKLAVGRAIFKDADVYILDEPDSSLDIHKQYELIDIYKNIMKNKIGIYVTHKVNYVQNLSTYIYVIENGTIKEKGTHKDLIENSTVYKNLFDKYKEYI
ncbi:ABC transporter ATP-binding protein [Peptacetobacter hominis]|uniref:ABC transporter ATP-binding protein n=1 Tax=Peptacetobacter hominis TaxID=2743610 RepID=A0A544QTM3_9FIRM|nr:ABC transporter ATP-binding protein [Peptacetobacter hominis]TQQ84043.1 ABC transporter ATP-binding protein [Peptacetobacter hominis]